MRDTAKLQPAGFASKSPAVARIQTGRNAYVLSAYGSYHDDVQNRRFQLDASERVHPRLEIALRLPKHFSARLTGLCSVLTPPRARSM